MMTLPREVLAGQLKAIQPGFDLFLTHNERRSETHHVRAGNQNHQPLFRRLGTDGFRLSGPGIIEDAADQQSQPRISLNRP